MTEVTVRVYGSLSDFLPTQRRQITRPHVVGSRQSVKDLIESLGVPHPEIDLILVNGISVPFDYTIQSADRIAVYLSLHERRHRNTQLQHQPLQHETTFQ